MDSVSPANPSTRYLGFDTETYQGRVKVLCLSDGRFTENGETEALLDFLYQAGHPKPDGSEDATLVAWNLGFDEASILKPWVETHAEELRRQHFALVKARKRMRELEAEAAKSADRPAPKLLQELQALKEELEEAESIARFTTRRWRVTLIGAKGMSICPKESERRHRKGATVWLFDAAAWYSSSFGGVALDVAAKKYLGESKNAEALGIDRAKIGSEAGYYESHRAAVVKYCIQDSHLTARLMERAALSFERLGYPFPDKPFSRASVSREYLKVNGNLEGTIREYARLKMDARAGLWCKSFQGGVFLLLGAGRFENPYAIDLNSAYPRAMVDFPSLEGAYPVDLDDDEFEAASFKFYRIRVRPTPRTPTRDAGERRKIYGWSVQETERCVTALDLEAMDRCGDPYTILEAVGIVCPSPETPLSYLQEIFDRKAEIKKEYGSDSVEYASIKILLNGTYGILAQRKPHETRFTNLIYASYVTAHCRRALWFATHETERRGDSIIALATDGILATGEGARAYWREQDSTVLGEWSFTNHEEAVCFESGIGILDGREVKRRGMPKLSAALLKECHATSLTNSHDSPTHLRQAIIERRTEEINVFRAVERTLCPVQAAADAKMTFPRDFGTAPLSSFFERSWAFKLRGQDSRATLAWSPSGISTTATITTSREIAGETKKRCQPTR